MECEVLNYTGDGKYGSSNAKSLTFSFAPKFLLLCGYYHYAPRQYTPNKFGIYSTFKDKLVADTSDITTSYTNNTWLWYEFFDNSNHAYHPGNMVYAKKSSDGKTFTWYYTQSSGHDMNRNGEKYYIIGIG